MKGGTDGNSRANKKTGRKYRNQTPKRDSYNKQPKGNALHTIQSVYRPPKKRETNQTTEKAQPGTATWSIKMPACLT